MSHRYGIDSFVVRDQRCFGWGWFLDDDQPALQCELRLPLASGAEQSLVCVPGGMRDDLAKAFPGVGHASAAGFLVQGKLQGRLAKGEQAVLVATLRDGSVRYGEVPSVMIAAHTGDGGVLARGMGLLRGLRLRLREQGAGSVARRMFSRLRTAVRGEWARKVRASFLTPIARWQLRQHPGPVALVFDHAMGGGANKFRRELVDRLAASGKPVILVVPLLHSLQYQVTLHIRGQNYEWVEDRLPPLLQRWQRLRQLEMYVNELVSFQSPLEIMDWCRARRTRAGCELWFYVHDYHAVCPAWTLVSVDGTFCNVPGLEVCRRCLPANRANTLGFSAGIELPEWRDGWGRFLAACDHVVAFSRASMEILGRVYPWLPTDARVQIEPHFVDTSALRQVQAVPGPPLVIAVAGHISNAKGAAMLRDMAAIIRREHLPMRIEVFGTLEHHDAADGIEVHGQYAPGELPGLLERSGASICLLPSVCAETFSFVTAEYMAMGMPVAVFPTGAPPERVAGYDKGLVISKIDAATAVAEIAGFAKRMFPAAFAGSPSG